MHYHWEMPPVGLLLQTDSDWATCKETRRSKSGGVIFRGTHVIHFWCKMQDRIATSSGVAELKSSCKGYSELLQAFNLAVFLTGVTPRLNHNIDATACRGILLRQGAGTLKHLDIKQLWVQEVARYYDIYIYIY